MTQPIDIDVAALRRLDAKVHELEGPALAGDIDAARWMSARGDLNRELLRQFPTILAALERVQELERERDAAVLREVALHEQIPTEQERQRTERLEAAARRVVGRVRIGAELDPLVADLQAALAAAPAEEGRDGS